MNRKRFIKLIMTLLPLTFVTAMMGNACSQLDSGDVSSSADGGPGQLCDNEVPFETLPGANTVAVVYGSQVLENMASCTNLGLEGLSQRTQDENTARSPSFSQYGYVKDVNSAMMMGIAAVAIEVCNDLANKERTLADTSRLIFNTFGNFTLDVGNAAIDDAFTRMARACWGRNPTDTEKTTVREEIVNLNTTNPQFKAISICTSVLASLDGVKQ